MPSGTPLTPEQKALIRELYAAGVFDNVIAKQLGIGKDCIKRHRQP